MFKPKLVVSNENPVEPPQDRKLDAIIRRGFMMDSAGAEFFGDVFIDDAKMSDIPACRPSEDK